MPNWIIKLLLDEPNEYNVIFDVTRVKTGVRVPDR